MASKCEYIDDAKAECIKHGVAVQVERTSERYKLSLTYNGMTRTVFASVNAKNEYRVARNIMGDVRRTIKQLKGAVHA